MLKASRTQSVPTLAVTGCVVNGRGEAKDADVGIAGGKGHGILFAKGKIVGKAKEKDLVHMLLAMVQKMASA